VTLSSSSWLLVLQVMTGVEEPDENGEEPLSLVPDFIENVEQYLTKHNIENIDVLIEKLQQKLQLYTMAENRALTRRQKQMERQAHLNKSIACVDMLIQKQESQEEAIVDYSLGGAQTRNCNATPT
jgi:predicted house-cleaning noncanonical NTP pyrophosphatase (MazG superfamily)